MAFTSIWLTSSIAPMSSSMRSEALRKLRTMLPIVSGSSIPALLMSSIMSV